MGLMICICYYNDDVNTFYINKFLCWVFLELFSGLFMYEFNVYRTHNQQIGS
jgi:hypothetical protein